MPQVPYTPAATAQPEVRGEAVTVNPSPAAFGANVAAALEHAGTTLGQSGNELFARAMALQQLNNENAARDAQTKFATQSSELHAQYGALTGKDAADGLQPYLKAQADLRTQIRGSLRSPDAQRMYDTDSLPFMQRNVFSAAGHAADENKKYTIGTYNATADIALKSVSDNPDQPGQTLKQVQDATANAAMLAHGTHDPNDPMVRDAVMNATSRWTAERILGKAKTDPISAEKMFEEYGDGLTSPDRDRVQGILEGRSAAVGGVSIAKGVFDAHRQPDGTYDATTQQMQDEVRQKAADAMPDNKLLPDVAVGKLDGMINQDRYAQRQDIDDTKRAIDGAIIQGNVKDVQQLLAMPGMDKTIQKLPPGQRSMGAIQGYINRFNDATHRTTREDTAIRVNGLMNNDVRQFLDLDLTKLDLSKADMVKYMNKQAELTKDPKQDPRVSQSLALLKGAMPDQLQALGLMTRDKNNPDDYDHFTGALQEALTLWREDHGKPPSYEELVDKIGPQLIQQHSVPGRFFGTNTEPTFRGWAKPMPEEVPEEFKNKVISDVVKAGGTAPSDIQVYQAYLRQQFTKLYSGSAGTTQEKPNGRPTVPTSK